MKRIEIENYTNFQNCLMAALPQSVAITTEQIKELYDIQIEYYGYVHDTGFKVVLTQRNSVTEEDPIHGEGWKGIEQQYKEAVEAVKKSWEYAARYGYH